MPETATATRELTLAEAVREALAEEMRRDPKTVYLQLGASVCRNKGFRNLMAQGAVMRYDFTEYKTNRTIGTQSYTAKDCGK